MNNWSIKDVYYHDKKKHKVWITVIVEDQQNEIRLKVEFEYDDVEIKEILVNGAKDKTLRLTSAQKEQIHSAAMTKARKYM